MVVYLRGPTIKKKQTTSLLSTSVSTPEEKSFYAHTSRNTPAPSPSSASPAAGNTVPSNTENL